ncbi:HNH endonuclease [Natronolimnohabitans innermongolicus]|uniref:Uncharacterized protein n=1 Tax=Natronolimnohabitans innermongolicus JCM 12255 TaxID=1227499 RepID=L9XAU6_9EURY|nr:hypothetical protein [Natronolimnohabitans innermongolicus]ELY58850.1 hypothetical protein C493_06177 [Natronolimnohabitans innermongolicus JCM 12255]
MSRDWQADRRAVFDRDDHACRYCETSGDPDEPTALRTVPVGAVPLDGTVHESALVTVCTDCFRRLEAPTTASDGDALESRESLFGLVRTITQTQGDAISDVAAVASLATSLPERLGAGARDGADARGDENENGRDDADESDADGERVDDVAVEYRRHRRDVRLAIDLVDASLERLDAVDDGRFDDDVQRSLETVGEAAAELQTTLRRIVERCETVPAGLGRCHGCFEPLPQEAGKTETTACQTCGLEVRETADWRRDDGAVAFDRLFSAINDDLQSAPSTTTTLTERATALAAQLTA